MEEERGEGKRGGDGTLQWRTQDFKMGGVEVPQAPRGEELERGDPLPTGGLGRGTFIVLFVENTIF